MRIELENRNKWREYAAAALKNLLDERALRVAEREESLAARSWFRRTFADDSIQKLISWEINNWNQRDIDICERIIDACSRAETGQIFLSGTEYKMVMYWKDAERS